MDGMMGVMGPMMILMCFIGLLLIIGLVVAVVFAVRAVTDDGRRTDRSDALAILEERYARGELDRDEFIERRDVLRTRRS